MPARDALKHALLCAGLAAFAVAPAAFAQTASENESTESAAQEPEVELSPDIVMATVNGKDITLGALIALRRELPEQYQQLPDELLTTGLLEQLIDQHLLAKAAIDAGLDKKPAVSIAIENQTNAVLADSFMRSELVKKVTEEGVEAAYQEQYVNGDAIEEVRAGHILVDSEEKAADLKRQLDEGADFAELAAEHGTDGTKDRGGDLGWFVHEQMVPAFADAAFAMKEGEISAPVQSDFGWHIIKLEGRRDKPAPALAEVREQIIAEMTREATGALVEQLRGEAEVSRTETGVPAAAIRADDLLND